VRSSRKGTCVGNAQKASETNSRKSSQVIGQAPIADWDTTGGLVSERCWPPDVRKCPYNSTRCALRRSPSADGEQRKWGHLLRLQSGTVPRASEAKGGGNQWCTTLSLQIAQESHASSNSEPTTRMLLSNLCWTRTKPSPFYRSIPKPYRGWHATKRLQESR
jgi:hypothetical protein